ncbi:MAG: epimerase [Casimicrobiaceae bacterium]
MHLLILGGTKFLGRHCIDAAIQRAHAVTMFTRGRVPNPWGDAVTALIGDRDPLLPPGLDALRVGTWDAVIDTSGYLPRCVGASAALLAERVRRYLFVSSVSVYAHLNSPGTDETGQLALLPDPNDEDVGKHYGPLKVACEQAVSKALGDRALIVRPGLIVGPHDPTDRFGYWVARFMMPETLGDRPPDAVVPAPPARPIQCIDVRDLAQWMLDLIERGAEGVYNATSPAGQWSMGDLVDALAASAKSGAPRPVWVDEVRLLAHNVVPWTGLPLWIPATTAELAWLLAIDARRAQAAGLTTRPLADTIAATAAWLARRDRSNTWKEVLSAQAERDILQSM